MERRSDKHSPRVDEALEDDARSMTQGSPVEARAEEEREKEGPGEGEPVPDARLIGGRSQYDGGRPTDEELEARSELARHLQPAAFPARPAELSAVAERRFAPGWVLDALDALPDRRYETAEDVWQELGGSRELRGLR